jgi:hypothetical protein
MGIRSNNLFEYYYVVNVSLITALNSLKFVLHLKT